MIDKLMEPNTNVPMFVRSRYAKRTRIDICGMTSQSNLDKTRLSALTSISVISPEAETGPPEPDSSTTSSFSSCAISTKILKQYLVYRAMGCAKERPWERRQRLAVLLKAIASPLGRQPGDRRQNLGLMSDASLGLVFANHGATPRLARRRRIARSAGRLVPTGNTHHDGRNAGCGSYSRLSWTTVLDLRKTGKGPHPRLSLAHLASWRPPGAEMGNAYSLSSDPAPALNS